MSESDCYCEPCKAKRYERNSLTSSAIRSYSYTPASGWLPHSLPNDPFPYHMGVELETSVNDDGERYIDGRLAASLRRPKTMWVPKHDGSVTGPEFASHPATLTYWQSKQSDLDEMFRLLIHAGYRSHNGGRAGMHVNISKTAFDGDAHLHRFLTFLWANREWALVVSQRRESHADRWAQFRPYGLYDAGAMLGTRTHTHKYSVVHAPYGQGRLEFRLPRGTLRSDRFMKNLQWTAAMIAWTRAAGMSWGAASFMEWVASRDLYENLDNFIRENSERIDNAVTLDGYYRDQRLAECGVMV
jgi:hypothetical protein